MWAEQHVFLGYSAAMHDAGGQIRQAGFPAIDSAEEAPWMRSLRALARRRLRNPKSLGSVPWGQLFSADETRPRAPLEKPMNPASIKPLANLALALGLLMAVVFAPAMAGPPKDWTFLPMDKALATAKQEDRRVFLYFGRQGCPSCEKTNRESFTDPRVIERLNANYVLAYVDSESGKRLRLPSGERITEMEVGVRFKVFGTPFFYFMEPDGSPIIRAPGYKTAEDFLLLDAYVNGGHYRTQEFAEFKAAQS
jgi:thioredoxin-related protein